MCIFALLWENSKLYIGHGKSACPSKQVPEEIIENLLSGYDEQDIECIVAHPENELSFVLKDGTSDTHHWKDRSRKESWTDEMKAKAAEDGKRRGNKGGRNATD